MIYSFYCSLIGSNLALKHYFQCKNKNLLRMQTHQKVALPTNGDFTTMNGNDGLMNGDKDWLTDLNKRKIIGSR
jgi:hypothetical protein